MCVSDEGFGGFANRETWIVDSWLSCDNTGIWLFRELMKEENLGLRAAKLRERVLRDIQVCYFTKLGFDIAMVSFERVNWQQIIDQH